MNKKETLKKLLRIAQKQQAIIEKLASDIQTINYKGYTLKCFEEGGDWICEISLEGDPEGYMPVFSRSRDRSIDLAKHKVDKILKSM
jgi:hypothetical protein